MKLIMGLVAWDKKDIRGATLPALGLSLHDKQTQEPYIPYINFQPHSGFYLTCPPTTKLQLVNTAVHVITALAIIVTAIAGPVARAEKFALFNGNHSVMVESGISSVNPGNTLQVLAEGDIDCKGSALRETLSGSCDDAYRKVVPSNTYSTYYDAADIGTCSGYCGLFVRGPEQNYVEVERDFSDLQGRMEELLLDPGKAQRIADNIVKAFRERYFTPAAEACYWRALWAQWAEISWNLRRELEDRPAVERGLRYESFILLDSKDMLKFSFIGN